MKRFVALLLTLLMLVIPSLTACNRSYDEDEVKAAAEELLERSMVLNSIYYGEGIHHINSNYQTGSYYEADPFHLAKLGFQTIGELKTLTAEVFSQAKCERMFDQAFSPLSDEGEIILTTRYYQAYDEVYGTEPTRIMVYKDYHHIFEDRLVGYDYSTLTVTEVKGETLYLTVGAVVENEDGESQSLTVKFSMVEEKLGWRLNSDTFANYNKYLDSEYFN